MEHLLFVYGSLRRGERHHDLLAGARFLGSHRTEPRYIMFDLGAYPGVVSGGTTAISGDVFVIDEVTLERLDAFEGCPDEYVRRQIPTPFGLAWVYVCRRPPTRVPTILSGDWRRR
jgi:gamma-glutamylaminecyclotransferase